MNEEQVQCDNYINKPDYAFNRQWNDPNFIVQSQDSAKEHNTFVNNSTNIYQVGLVRKF